MNRFPFEDHIESPKQDSLALIAASLEKIAKALYIDKQDGTKISVAQMINSIGYNLKK
jgi:hypothetical protein